MFSENLHFKFYSPPKQYNTPPEIGGKILVNVLKNKFRQINKIKKLRKNNKDFK